MLCNQKFVWALNGKSLSFDEWIAQTPLDKNSKFILKIKYIG
jgi:hypothetical protein